MDFKTEILMLMIIKNGGNVNSLIKAGLYYSEIGEYCNELVKQGLIMRDNQVFSITNKGIKVLNQYMNNIKHVGCEKFILEYSRLIKVKRDMNDIYIPDKI